MVDAHQRGRQALVLGAQRRIARAGMKIYLGLPNYFNNLARIGFTEDDWTNGGSDRGANEGRR